MGRRRGVGGIIVGGRGYTVCLEDGDDFGFGEVEAEGFHGGFEFVVVDAFVFVEVEEAELLGGEHSDVLESINYI